MEIPQLTDEDYDFVNRAYLAEDEDRWLALVQMVMLLRIL